VLVLFKIMHIMNCLCHSLSSQLIVPSSGLDASCFDMRKYHLSNCKKFELLYVLRQLVTADIIQDIDLDIVGSSYIIKNFQSVLHLQVTNL